MRSRWQGIGAASAAVLLTASIALPASADDSPLVEFADPDLGACIHDALGVDRSTDLTQADMLGLTSLWCSGLTIDSLAGLETATNLESLTLAASAFLPPWPSADHPVADDLAHYFDPIASLPSLHSLGFPHTLLPLDISLESLLVPPITSLSADMYGGPYGQDLEWLAGGNDLETLTLDFRRPPADIGPIGGLSNLTSLELRGLQGNSLAPISNVTTLTSLDLPDAVGTDWATLASLTQLEHVDLSGSNVDTIDWLGSATHLADVRLRETSVTDASALVGKPLTHLTLDDSGMTDLGWLRSLLHARELSLRGLGITDLSFLGDISELEALHLDNNDIDDLGPLYGAPALSTLTFSGNQVDDIAVLASLPAISTVLFDNNRVTDVSSLSGLPHLANWSAQIQKGDLPPISACEVQPRTGGTDFDGGHLTLTPDRGVVVREAYLVPFNGGVEVSGHSGAYPFSVRFTAEVAGYTEPCAWPAGYLPTFIFPEALTPGTVAAIDLTFGSYHGTNTPRFEWRDGLGNVISTSFRFTPSTADIGKLVTPIGRTVVSGMQTVEVAGAPVAVAGGVPEVMNLGLVNPPLAGFTSVVDGLSRIPAASVTCAWRLDDTVVATNSSCEYLVPTSAAGKKVAVTVIAKRPGYVDQTYMVAPQTVLKYYAPLRLRLGTVSGTPDVGKVLTASPTTYSVTPTSYGYQWLRDGKPISGATSRTYTVVSADAGKKVAVAMTAQRSGYLPATDVSAGVSIRRPFTQRPVPKITGSLSTGHRLTAVRGTWSPSPTSFAYQWYRNGKAISGATKSTYTTKSSDLGAKFTVKITAKKSGYTTASTTSAAVKILKKFTRTPTPTISGTKQVKHTLTARAGTWSPSASLSYQWYRNGKAIAGATKSTYKPGVKDAYATFKVKVTGKKSGYAAVSKTSKAVTASGIKYANCKALHKAYPGGVAKSKSVKGITKTTFVSAKLYALNAARDGDKDGWACE